MEDNNSMFRIPTTNSVADVQKTTVNAVDLSAAPYEIQNQNNNTKVFNLYDELTAISEEVISCRNASLGRA